MSLLSSIPHFLLATILCVAGLFDEAITQYRKLVSLDPRNAQSRCSLTPMPTPGQKTEAIDALCGVRSVLPQLSVPSGSLLRGRLEKREQEKGTQQ